MSERQGGDLAEARLAPTSRSRIVILLVTLAVVLGAVGIMVAVVADNGHSGNAAGDASMVAPLDLASVSTATAGLYHSAEAHRSTYIRIPCFCGCEESLGHRNLYDCFVRADGAGWEAHASGCGVCIAESVTANRLIDRGRDPSAVRDAVIAEFGSTVGTTPPVAGHEEEKL